MSHNFRYRGTTSDTDLRAEAGHYNSANHRHISPEPDFYRPSQEILPSSYSASSSSRGSTLAQDGALRILNSCGLEPSDLSLLAELPEDVLTIESLPQVLKQIKGKRGTAGSFPPSTLSMPSSYSSSSYHQVPGSSSRLWDQPSSQAIQYPLDYVGHGSLPSEEERWRDSRTNNSVGSDLPSTSLSSSGYIDFQHRPGTSDYGKTAGPFSPQDLSPFSSAGQERSRPTRISEPRSSYPPDVYHIKPLMGCEESQTSSERGTSQQSATTSIPSEKKALDFHGTCPTVFPYSCSLCDITVLSEKVWIKHINNTQHAEGQLSLLQKFPNWDCRVETVRANNQTRQDKRKDEENMTRSSKAAIHSDSNLGNGKVVCVKFPPHSVDELYLRKLTQPFGQVVKILLFPSLAFLELNSIEQARELVKFHITYPQTVNGEPIELSISNTFNFLQSSQVVSFTPFPTGRENQSSLISIIKRFGQLLYTLFLPTMAFVEMENSSDAQKLVDSYCYNGLRLNNTLIKVSFSGEYKTLMGVPSAKKHEEKKISTKRARSSSQERKGTKRSKVHENVQRRTSTDRSSGKDIRTRSSSRDKRTRSLSASRDKSREKITERRNRSRSREKSKEKSSRETRVRSKSREKLDSKKKNRSRSRDKSKERSSKGTRTRSKSRERSDSKMTRSRSRDKSKEKSSKETRTRSKSREKSDSKKTRSRSRDISKEKSSKETRTRSKSREKSDSKKKTRSRSRDKSKEKSSKENRTRSKSREKLDSKKQNRSRDKSKEKSSKETRNRSKSREKSDSKKKTRSRSRDKSKEKSSKATRSRSREKSDSKNKTRSRSRDKSKEKSSKETRTRTRSKSREKSDSKKKTRSRSRDKSKEKSSKETRARSKSREKSDSKKKTRSRSRDKSKEKSSKETRTRSKSREKSESKKKTSSRSSDKSKEKSSKETRTRSKSREKSESKREGRSTDKVREKSNKESKTSKLVEAKPPDTKSRTKTKAAADTQQTELDPVLSTEDSDIEGMEVLGEDGENLKEDNMEIQSNVEKKEVKATKADSPEKDMAVKVGNKRKEECSETQLEEDEEESDFPVDLDNCITLDELVEDQSDNPGEDDTGDAQSLSSRVVYFRGLPTSSFTNTDFIRLVKDYGKAVRYLLIRQSQEGFIEMSSSSEAQRAAQELTRKPATLNRSELIVNISHKYQSLSNGLEIPPDSNHEESKSETPDKKKTKNSSEKSKDEVSESKKSDDEKSSSNKAGYKKSDKKSLKKKNSTVKGESEARKAPVEDLERESPKANTSKNGSEKPEKVANRNTADEELVSDQNEGNLTTATPKDLVVKKETLPETNEEDEKRKPENNQTECNSNTEGLKKETKEEKISEGQMVCCEDDTQEATQTGDSPKPQQKPENDKLVQVQSQMVQESAPAGDAAEPKEPIKPVGTEFVRPVVGYFCNLCELIYADEDEAKLQHCSSLMHYRKYQEKTGKDPWIS